MKMTMGSTWNAKTTPMGPDLAPSGPNTNWLPASAYSSNALTPALATWKTRPKPVFSTTKAKANCRPRPQSNSEGRMAFRLVEKA